MTTLSSCFLLSPSSFSKRVTTKRLSDFYVFLFFLIYILLAIVKIYLLIIFFFVVYIHISQAFKHGNGDYSILVSGLLPKVIYLTLILVLFAPALMKLVKGKAGQGLRK